VAQSNHRPKFEFTGGNLCLDFINTVDNRTSPGNEKELLNSYSDLLRWGEQARTLTPKQAERLLRLAAEAPGHAQSAIHRAVQLREAMYSVFSAVAERRGIPGAALGVLNAAMQKAAQHAQIVHTNRNFSWEWTLPEESLDSVVWPVIRSTAELLTSDDVGYVRACASSDCGWLFLDKTKNHRRRWCEMKTCGNRNKARRYYQRTKAG